MTVVRLAAGDAAPPFDLDSGQGPRLTLEELERDHSRLLLVFYPFAFSPVCDSELAELAGMQEELAATGTGVAAISTDPKYALAAFAAERDLRFPLLSDFWPHGATAQAYGTFDDSRGTALRGTFLIRQGRLLAAEVGPAGQARDFRAFLAARSPHH
ncbi:redoxin domain-containing protein [Sediminivirga luteola]|uniref:Peroxiredoxin n=1 Tax=Sediminivirga luteola TaxID=1774748 RepID=A0A8J2TWR8_9MICO|nr:redoxin domain-containing protein [Sediminivirga luteola]GGA09082.1 peroxiredoxin [Sediminivirga luteola]